MEAKIYLTVPLLCPFLNERLREGKEDLGASRLYVCVCVPSLLSFPSSFKTLKRIKPVKIFRLAQLFAFPQKFYLVSVCNHI